MYPVLVTVVGIIELLRREPCLLSLSLYGDTRLPENSNVVASPKCARVPVSHMTLIFKELSKLPKTQCPRLLTEQ